MVQGLAVDSTALLRDGTSARGTALFGDSTFSAWTPKPPQNSGRFKVLLGMRFDPINFVARSIRLLVCFEGCQLPACSSLTCSSRPRRARRAKLLHARPPFAR